MKIALTSSLTTFATLSLKCHDLGADRGASAIVRGMTLDLQAGQALQLFGDNGVGKSTLLSVFAGLIAPAGGRLEWFKDNELINKRDVHQFTGFLGHKPALKGALRVTENLEYWTAHEGIKRAGRDAQIQSALEVLELSDCGHRKLAHLSAGQQKRVALARIFLAQRPIWILDEPIASLDGAGAKLVTNMISEHLSNGGIAIFSTHHPLNIQSIQIRLSKEGDA